MGSGSDQWGGERADSDSSTLHSLTPASDLRIFWMNYHNWISFRKEKFPDAPNMLCSWDRERETQQEINLCKVEKVMSWVLQALGTYPRWPLPNPWHLGSPYFTSQPEAHQVDSLSFLPDKAGRDLATPRPVSSLLSCFPWPWSAPILGDSAAEAQAVNHIFQSAWGGGWQGARKAKSPNGEFSFTSRWPWQYVKYKKNCQDFAAYSYPALLWLSLAVEQLLGSWAKYSSLWTASVIWSWTIMCGAAETLIRMSMQLFPMGTYIISFSFLF